MSDLLLWGAGGHGKVVLDVAQAIGRFGAISFIDDAAGPSARRFCGCLVYSFRECLEALGASGRPAFLIAIGKNETRAACFARALAEGLRPVTLVHPSAIISASVRIGEGTIVMPGVIVNAGATIGANCILNTGAVIEHDCIVGDHVHISPGVVLGGTVTVNSFAHMGIGAIALPGSEIGRRAVVGGGAVVLDSVPPDSTVAGVPARPLRRPPDSQASQ